MPDRKRAPLFRRAMRLSRSSCLTDREAYPLLRSSATVRGLAMTPLCDRSRRESIERGPRDTLRCRGQLMEREGQIVEPFTDDSLGVPAVRGVLHRPATASNHGVVLTHGASGDCKGPLLTALAAAFASRGATVLRCDLPYRQERRTGPPSPARAA